MNLTKMADHYSSQKIAPNNSSTEPWIWETPKLTDASIDLPCSLHASHVQLAFGFLGI